MALIETYIWREVAASPGDCALYSSGKPPARCGVHEKRYVGVARTASVLTRNTEWERRVPPHIWAGLPEQGALQAWEVGPVRPNSLPHQHWSPRVVAK